MAGRDWWNGFNGCDGHYWSDRRKWFERSDRVDGSYWALWHNRRDGLQWGVWRHRCDRSDRPKRRNWSNGSHRRQHFGCDGIHRSDGTEGQQHHHLLLSGQPSDNADVLGGAGAVRAVLY